MIQVPPEVGQAADEGQNVNLTCIVFESPKPIVIWHKGHKQLTGGRYKVMDHGDLQIMVGQKVTQMSSTIMHHILPVHVSEDVHQTRWYK